MHQAQLSHQLLSLKESLATGSEEVWVFTQDVGPVACTKSGRQGIPIPPAHHIAGNGRTQSRGQSTQVRYSQSSGGSRQTSQSAAQPIPQ